MVIWHLDEADFWSPIGSIRAVTIHEALHVLLLVSHSARPASIMGRLSLNSWSPRDAELRRLNSHPLIRPGMTMDGVREVVVLTDELLDYPQTGPGDTPGPLDLVWRVYVALAEADSASFRLSGGWVDRACNYTFGFRRGPIELSIGDFGYFKGDPGLIHLDLHTTQFYIVYSQEDAESLHWQLTQAGTWKEVDAETVVDPDTLALEACTWELHRDPRRAFRRVPHLQGNGDRRSPRRRNRCSRIDQDPASHFPLTSLADAVHHQDWVVAKYQ